MKDGIPFKQDIKGSIVKIGPLITNNFSRHPITSKIFSLKNFMMTLNSFILVGMASTHLNT